MKLGETPRTNDPNKKREVPPAGMHLGILFRIVDAGWCVSEYQGEKKMRTEGRLEFELWPMDDNNKYITMADGRPFSVAPGFQGWLTFHKMGEILTSWVGTPTADSETILGQPAMLNIIHKPYKNKLGEDCIAANVVAVMPIPDMIKKNMQMPEMANPPMVYSCRDHNEEDFQKLPEWIRKHIQEKSDTWQKLQAGPKTFLAAGPDIGDGDNFPPF